MSNQFVYLHTQTDDFPQLEQFDTGILEYAQNGRVTVHFLRINQHISLDNQLVVPFDLNQTGDTQAHKVCDRCYKYLNTSTDFENNRHKKDNLITKRPSCRACRKQKNGKPISSQDRKIWDQTRPADGTLFTCPICAKTTIVGIVKIVLDHNHHTGEVRGWLCESCNTGIGRFDDSIEQIERAQAWLER